MKNALVQKLRKRRRGLTVFLIILFVGLTTLSTVTVLRFAGADGMERRFDPSREWGAVVFALVPWVAAFVFAAQFLRHRIDHAAYERSIQDSLRASLDENRLARMRIKFVAVLHGLLLLALPLIVHQLRAVGKAGDEILVPAFVIWPLIALGIGFGLLYHYRRKLLPEKRELEDLLEEYRSGS